ncbi:MAG TPA: MoaD/ThiS family protein [Gammaproteobacteria bacterium]|nr:MoaD/ThiS family protein [Gammaproteobacteria bacterium]
MPRVVFTENLKRHVDCAPAQVAGTTVGQALGNVFENNPRLERYVLDDQGALRKHMLVFVDGSPAKDRVRLSDRVEESSEIFVMQALSGG